MKICVLGAGGLLGHMLIRVLGESNDVYGTTREEPNSSEPLAKFLSHDKWIGGIDAAVPKSIISVFDQNQFDLVINCIGLVKQRIDLVDDRQMMSLNGEFPHTLADIANQNRARVIQLSTDCVFSGKKGDYVESDKPDPVDLYGRSKLLGELIDNTNLTLRAPFIGPELYRHKSFFDWVLSSRNLTVNGYKRAIYSGFSTSGLAEIVGKIIKKDDLFGNLWHLASQPISKFDLIAMVDDAFKLNIQLLEDWQYTCDRSLNMNLLHSRMAIEVPSWADMVEKMHLDLKNYEYQSGVFKI